MAHRAGQDQGSNNAGPWGGRGKSAIALDIGGTKTVAALVSDGGEILGSATMATRGGHTDVLARMKRLVAEAAGPVGLGRVAGLGISSAGPMDLVAGVVAPVHIPELRNVPLLKRMAALVPGRPARLLGDGLAAAAGEHWIGAGRGCEDMLAWPSWCPPASVAAWCWAAGCTVERRATPAMWVTPRW